MKYLKHWICVELFLYVIYDQHYDQQKLSSRSLPICR